jgi:hypothetical protein
VPHQKLKRRGRRNIPLLVGGIIVALIGILTLSGPLVSLVAKIADGTATVGDVLARLVCLVVFVAIVIWMVTARRAEDPAGATAGRSAADIAKLPPDAPEYRAATEDFRQRRDQVTSGSAQVIAGIPTADMHTGGFIERRTDDEADAEMALSAAVYSEDLRPSLRSWPTVLQGPYLALGVWAWGSLICAVVLIFWGSSPHRAFLDAGVATLAMPLWVLAVATASRALDGPDAPQTRLQAAGYRIVTRTWTSPAFTWILVLALILAMIAVMIGLIFWNTPTRPGLGPLEGFLAPYGGWGGGLALIITFWSMRDKKKVTP